MLSVLLLTAIAQVPGFESATPWEKVSSEDGFTLERRPVTDSSSLEYRVTVVTLRTVDVLCEAIFEFASRTKDVPGLASRTELYESPDERVIYDRFNQTLVSNRDYAVTVRRTRLAPSECRIRFWATNEKAPKLADGWVRIDKLWGGWTFTAGQTGGATLVYTVFAAPGGSVPAVFANGSQRDRALETVKLALERARSWKR